MIIRSFTVINIFFSLKDGTNKWDLFSIEEGGYVHRNFWCKKVGSRINFGPKIGVKRIEAKRNLSPNKIMSKKLFGPKKFNQKNLSQKDFWVPQTYL